MRCQRCIWDVEKIINKLKIEIEEISLGEVVIKESNWNPDFFDELKGELRKEGFELIEGKETQIVEQIKTFILYWIQTKSVIESKLNLSDFLSMKVGMSYSSLSTIFSVVEGITLEKYFIQQRVEKAKELILAEELNIAEISYELGYNSPAHFSGQFKLVTGLSPTQYKNKLNRK